VLTFDDVEGSMETRKFGKRCANCGQRTMEIATVDYSTDWNYDGRTYRVHVPNLSVPKCSNCGALSFDRDADLQTEAEFRKLLGILFPAEILANRERLGLSQQQLADLIGASVHAVERWESGGQIQQRTQDKLLRLLFFTPDVRAALERDLESASTATGPPVEAVSVS
jgi:putative zinc finger/helix-turn-helix YgiT family protein